MSEWISVEDRLPEDLEPVLGYFKGHGCAVCTFDFSVEVFVNDGLQAHLSDSVPLDELAEQPTHWMPLPDYKPA